MNVFNFVKQTLIQFEMFRSRLPSDHELFSGTQIKPATMTEQERLVVNQLVDGNGLLTNENYRLAFEHAKLVLFRECISVANTALATLETSQYAAFKSLRKPPSLLPHAPELPTWSMYQLAFVVIKVKKTFERMRSSSGAQTSHGNDWAWMCINLSKNYSSYLRSGDASKLYNIFDRSKRYEPLSDEERSGVYAYLH